MPHPKISAVSQLPIVTKLDVEDWKRGTTHQIRVQLVGNGLGQIVHIPVIVMRGSKKGPILGVTAAIHGDELNGIGLIHSLVRDLNPKALKGTLVAVPVVNVPGYLSQKRRFPDEADLNRIMPGKEGGTESAVYAHRFLERIAHCFEVLADLHTASAGRSNTFYVRADLEHEESAWMARAQYPDIILHSEPKDGTFRGEMMARGVPSITIELGNPQRLQRKMVKMGAEGLLNIMSRLGMIEHTMREARKRKPTICSRSAWMYTRSGGVLQVFPELGARIREGELVAAVHDIYGNLVEEYHAPHAGVVIGKSVNPVNATGSRILHLGELATRAELASVFK